MARSGDSSVHVVYVEIRKQLEKGHIPGSIGRLADTPYTYSKPRPRPRRKGTANSNSETMIEAKFRLAYFIT